MVDSYRISRSTEILTWTKTLRLGVNMARNFSGILWGLLFILVGALMLLDRLHIIYFDLGNFISTWWPLVLIVVGIGMILNRSSRDRRSKEM